MEIKNDDLAAIISTYGCYCRSNQGGSTILGVYASYGNGFTKNDTWKHFDSSCILNLRLFTARSKKKICLGGFKPNLIRLKEERGQLNFKTKFFTKRRFVLRLCRWKIGFTFQTLYDFLWENILLKGGEWVIYFITDSDENFIFLLYEHN